MSTTIRLTKKQQKLLLDSLSPSQMKSVKLKVNSMKGEGLKDIIPAISKVLSRMGLPRISRDVLKPFVNKILKSLPAPVRGIVKGRLNLTRAQKEALITALEPSIKKKIRDIAFKGGQSGEGIADVVKSAASVIGPLVKELGLPFVKSIVFPFFKKGIESIKLRKRRKKKKRKEGDGISLPGQGIRLAGQGGIRDSKKKRSLLY